MDNKDCGSCDYQGVVQPQRVECRIDDNWHERGYHCNDFKDYVQGKTAEERVKQAIEKKQAKERLLAEQREKELAEALAKKGREHAKELQSKRMQFDKKLWRASWWWQVILVFLGAILGFIANMLLNI